MKTLLIMGNDKISGEALKQIAPLSEHIEVVIDQSTNIRRIIRLLANKRISLSLLIRMLLCSILRKGKKPSGSIKIITSNQSLQELLCSRKFARVLLFRAGLIINAESIKTGIPMLNVHCAKIPEYAGLGSIWNAIRDKTWHQEATLHHVTTTIDGGDIVDSEPYALDPKKSYCKNENIAYQAGFRLLKRSLERIDSGEDLSPKTLQHKENEAKNSYNT